MPAFTGLIAATPTPFHEDGRLNLEMIPRTVEWLLGEQVDGFYVCGSTGEGLSLTSDERRAVAEAYVGAAAGRVPVLVQVGHNSLEEARILADHAREIGAAAVSATCPSYFKISCVPLLVDCMARVAEAAGELPFYYYHIPALTGAPLDMVAFLDAGSPRIPNLAGLKYTAPTLHEYLACRQVAGGRFDILWGVDEMLLAALATGARGAVGSTYNIAAPLYQRMIAAFQQGDLEQARRWQADSVAMIRCLLNLPFHAALKEVLRMLGLDLGPCRLPLAGLQPGQAEALRNELERLGFFRGRSATDN